MSDGAHGIDITMLGCTAAMNAEAIWCTCKAAGAGGVAPCGAAAGAAAAVLCQRGVPLRRPGAAQRFCRLAGPPTIEVGQGRPAAWRRGAAPLRRSRQGAARLEGQVYVPKIVYCVLVAVV